MYVYVICHIYVLIVMEYNIMMIISGMYACVCRRVHPKLGLSGRTSYLSIQRIFYSLLS